jgi:small subunit ribosomal protein S15
MPLQKEIKTQLIEEYQKHPTDTGSTEVQISILTTRIKQLTEHLKINKHDESSRRGLLIMVGRRRRLMNYLRRKDYVKYLDLVQKLQLRKLK